MKSFYALLILSLHFLGLAAPTHSSGILTAAQIQVIAPNSKSCAGARIPSQCATAEQAAPYISRSFITYKVTSLAEQAAVIGLMAFESVEFEYNRNQVPGVPGQGTRNMQSPSFNLKYAQSIPDVAPKLGSVNNDPAKVLDLLLANEAYDFGSGAWFLTTQCSREVRSALRTGSEEGWARFITSCVGTDANDARRQYWQRAVQALGVEEVMYEWIWGEGKGDLKIVL